APMPSFSTLSVNYWTLVGSTETLGSNSAFLEYKFPLGLSAATRPTLFCSEFSFLPAKVVSAAATAPVGVRRVPRPARPADFEEQPVTLRKLFLHHVSDRHGRHSTSEDRKSTRLNSSHDQI